MDRADPGTGQHRVGRFRDHRHVENNAVAFADAHRFVDVGHFADLLIRLVVRDVLVQRRVVAFPDDRRLITTCRQMPVEAVGADVQLTIFVPFDRDIRERVVDVLDLGVGRDPVDPFALLAPKGGGISDRGRIHLIIFGFVSVGVGRKGGGRRIRIAHVTFLSLIVGRDESRQ